MRPAAVAFVLWLGCLVASPAVATVSVVLGSSDPDPLYFVGETIHLTVHVTANEGEIDNTVFGQLGFSNGLVARTAQGQIALPGPPGGTWVTGTLPCTAVGCVAFNQVWNAGTPATRVPISSTDLLIAFADYAALAPGVASFTWGTTPSTQRFDFFGLTTAPGYTVTIVPEPTPAALLGIGLLGIGLSVRRRT